MSSLNQRAGINPPTTAERPHSHGRKRRRWPGVGGRLALAATAVLALLLLFGFGARSDGRRSWDNWLTNFRFSGLGSRQGGARTRTQRKRQFADPNPIPAYLGEGRAELGDYSVRVFDPVTRSTLRTDFRLQGRTSLENEASFERFMRRNHRFFREQVEVVLRTHRGHELTQPDLNLLGRKIVARVNRSLGGRVLESAEIRDFSVYESVDRSGFIPWEGQADPGVP